MVIGRRWFGWVGIVLISLAGLLVGLFAGRIPYLIAVHTLLRNLQRCDATTLRLRLDKEYYISHLIIAELLMRGEPIESFRDYISGLVRSDSPDRRRFGLEVLRIWPAAAHPPGSENPQE